MRRTFKDLLDRLETLATTLGLEVVEPGADKPGLYLKYETGRYRIYRNSRNETTKDIVGVPILTEEPTTASQTYDALSAAINVITAFGLVPKTSEFYKPPFSKMHLQAIFGADVRAGVMRVAYTEAPAHGLQRSMIGGVIIPGINPKVSGGFNCLDAEVIIIPRCIRKGGKLEGYTIGQVMTSALTNPEDHWDTIVMDNRKVPGQTVLGEDVLADARG